MTTAFIQSKKRYCKPSASVGINPSYANGLRNLYDMREGVGEIRDHAKDGVDSTAITGATRQIGATGQEILTDGVNDEIEIGSAADWAWMHGADDTSGFTWTVNVYMSLKTPEPDDYVTYFATQVGSSGQIGIALGIDDRSSLSRSRRIRVLISDGTTIFVNINTSDNVYPNDTKPHLFTVTYNQAAGSNNARAYLDGVEVGSATKSGGSPSTSNPTYAMHWGARPDGLTFLNAAYSYVMVHDYEMTAGQLAGLASSPYSIYAPQRVFIPDITPVTPGTAHPHYYMRRRYCA